MEYNIYCNYALASCNSDKKKSQFRLYIWQFREKKNPNCELKFAITFLYIFYPMAETSFHEYQIGLSEYKNNNNNKRKINYHLPWQ